MDDDLTIRKLDRIDELGDPDPAFLARLYEVVAGEIGFPVGVGGLARSVTARRRLGARPRRDGPGWRSERRGRRAVVLAAALVATALGLAAGGLLVGGPIRSPEHTASHPAPSPNASGPHSSDRLSPAASNRSSVPDPFRIARAVPLASFGLATPLGIAVGPTGLLYVLDTKPSVSVVDPTDGRLVRAWGTQGSGPRQFDLTAPDDNPGRGDIAVAADGRVAVADSGNHRVQVFGSDGASVTQFGTRGTADGQFGSLDDIAVGPDGSILVLDGAANRLSKFSAAGAFLWRSPVPTTDARVAGPIHGVAVRSDGSVLTNCEACAGLLVFDGQTGRLTGELAVPDLDGDGGRLTIDGSGNLYVELTLAEATLILDPSGRVIAQRVLAEGMHTMEITKTVSWGDPFYKAPVPAGSGRAYSFNRLGLVVLDVTLPSS